MLSDFISVGFCFYAFLIAVRPTRQVELWTLVLGFVLCLTIEVLQIYLPTPDSGTTDLITNTPGTYLDVLRYREIHPLVVARFPILGWFQTMEPRPE
jgi:glycopeptide antibiotics resistance protein